MGAVELPFFYHGTTVQFARAMATVPGTIDVTLGAGEFGRGFYTQTSAGNAMRWASGRSPNHAAVIELEIADRDYLALDRIVLTRAQAVRLTARLRKRNEETTYLKNCDALIGPLNGNDQKVQQKFESIASQFLLNGVDTIRTVLP